MNTASKIITAAAVALFAVAGAQAEEYQGVTTVQSQRSRAEVQAGAVAAAKAGTNLYGDAANAGVTQVASGVVDRNAVRAQAVAAAHDPLQNLDRKAFVNSTIPQQYTNGSLALRRQQQQSQQAAL
jgi:hypothetical protein